MAKALWVYLVTGEFGIPTVYKPSVAIRELRRLFSQYYLLNKQVILLKNTIQAILADNGVSLIYSQKTMLSSDTDEIKMLNDYDLSPCYLVEHPDQSRGPVEGRGAEEQTQERNTSCRRAFYG